MKSDSKNVVMDIAGVDSFRRVSNSHPLDLYIGKDVSARPTLLLISSNEPSHIFSSKLIGVHAGKRADERWALSFSLSDPKFEDIFYHFCDDIVESSADISDRDKGTLFICGRYVKWQELLKKNSSGLLSFAEIKGLVGELTFLKRVLFEKYTPQKALLSWIGPYKADQDFVCPESWYEVKAVVSGAESVHISSVEQLDTEMPGELVIVYLDKTSRSDPNRITLNNLVDEITENLPSGDERRILRDILIEQGYIHRDEYDEYAFKYAGHTRYAVTGDFPALRRKDIPESVTNAQYTISLASISEYIKEE